MIGRLKIPWEQSRAGSSPASSIFFHNVTKKIKYLKVMPIIKKHEGILPDQCLICYGNESNRESLLQTACCKKTASVGAEVIPKTYHKACLRKWDCLELE
ncbi:MAG: hypothetical protein K1060chlam1_01462 [Candidatus Anoxychlamydiales bacterium]|nr:hypothetical protein [Candidatus Anoxychlamydiales bacterium]